MRKVFSFLEGDKRLLANWLLKFMGAYIGVSVFSVIIRVIVNQGNYKTILRTFSPQR